MITNVQKTCILCGSAADLNTMMGVTLEDDAHSKVQVAVCDICSEDCTPKKARAAYMNRQAQIDEVLARAKALGMDLSGLTTGGLVIATEQPKPDPVTQPTQQLVQAAIPVGVTPVLEGDDVIPTSLIDRGRQVVSVGGQASHASGAIQTNVPSHASHDVGSLNSQLPQNIREGQVRMQVVAGRGGQPLVIPELRSDGMGVTRIRMVKSDDQQLQLRTKRVVAESAPIEAYSRPSYRDGYRDVQAERRCPICAGTGSIRAGAGMQICPKCQGTAVIGV